MAARADKLRSFLIKLPRIVSSLSAPLAFRCVVFPGSLAATHSFPTGDSKTAVGRNSEVEQMIGRIDSTMQFWGEMGTIPRGLDLYF